MVTQGDVSALDIYEDWQQSTNMGLFLYVQEHAPTGVKIKNADLAEGPFTMLTLQRNRRSTSLAERF